MTNDLQGHVTVLQVARGRGVSKTIDGQGNKVTDFNAGTYFRFQKIPFAGWHGENGAKALLDRLHKTDKHFMVPGEVLPVALDGKLHRRLKASRPDEKNGEQTLQDGKTRLLVLDVDGFQVADVDPVMEPESCARAVLSVLGGDFEQTSCWWCFTSSMKLKVDATGKLLLRMRLVFLLSKLESLYNLKRWARQKSFARLNLDTSIYSGNQPIYLAAPKVINGFDPIPFRYGFVDEINESVDLVLPKEEQFQNSGHGTWLPDDADPLELIGDHETGAGAYQGVLRAIWHIVRRSGKHLSDDDIKAMVRQRVAQAKWNPIKGHSVNYLHRQVITEPKLDTMIRNARHKQFAHQKLFAAISPDPDIEADKTIDLDELSLFFHQTVSHSARRPLPC